MYGAQLERLRRDSRELEYFVKRLEKKGNTTKAFDLQRKKEYLNSRIEELEEYLCTTVH
jgi:hypothetical protein